MTEFFDPLAPEGLPGPVRSDRIPPRGSTAELIAKAAAPLRVVHDPTFTSLFDRFGSARVVLLGAATHGTSEFYEARAITTGSAPLTAASASTDWTSTAWTPPCAR